MERLRVFEIMSLILLTAQFLTFGLVCQFSNYDKFGLQGHNY